MSKFDPKSPKESVPNVQSKFLTRDAIRWFKCKLKPSQNQKNMDLIEIIQFCLKIYDLLRHPHLWVGGWVDG